MSVKVNYKGRIGNCLFQYVYARLLAERNGFNLSTPFPYQKLLQTTPPKQGKIYSSPKISLEEPVIPNSDITGKPYDMNQVGARLDFYKKLENKLAPGQYLLDGYFEYSELFNPNEKLIKSYFLLDEFEKNTDDIVMNVRFGDFVELGRIISSDWYLKILEREKFDKLYIVGARANEPYLKAFKKYDPIIVDSDPWNDFHFIKSFDKIICSNSTYCWWAAFLSEATTIYVSDKWISPLLTSCKHSILTEADYLQSFTSSSGYSSVTGLVTLKESINLKLDGFIVPSNNHIKLYVTKCLKIIFDSVKNTKTVQRYVLQLHFGDVCEYCITLYDGKGWLSTGTALLPDCHIYFADWKSFYDWISCELKDIGKVSSYFKKKGNLNPLIAGFDLPAYKDELSDAFKDFSVQAPFLEYKEFDDLTSEIIKIINQGSTIAWFVMKTETQGELYFLCDADPALVQNNLLQQKFTEFYIINEISLNNGAAQNPKPLYLDNDLRDILYGTLNKLQIRLFRISFKDTNHRLISVEESLRLFYSIDADYLKIDNYIVTNDNTLGKFNQPAIEILKN